MLQNIDSLGEAGIEKNIDSLGEAGIDIFRKNLWYDLIHISRSQCNVKSPYFSNNRFK